MMLSRRTLFGAAAASAGVVLLSSCATVDSGSADLQRRFGDEKGVESIKITTDVPNESILMKDWTAVVLFTSEVTAIEVGALIGLFFTYAKRAGLAANTMRSVEFTTKAGCTLTLRNEWLDVDHSAEAAQAMFAVPNSSMNATMYVGAGNTLPGLSIRSQVLRDHAKDLARSAGMIAAGPVLTLFGVSYTITDQGVPDPFTVYADRKIGAPDLAFAATCERWTLTHATTGFILPFTPRTDARIVVYTDTEIPVSVKELAAARPATVTTPVVAYMHAAGDPYITIP